MCFIGTPISFRWSYRIYTRTERLGICEVIIVTKLTITYNKRILNKTFLMLRITYKGIEVILRSETLTILDIKKVEINNCFIIYTFS